MSEKIPVWVDTYEPQSNIKVFHPKESVNEIIQEISCMAKEKIEEYQIDWSKNTLEPLIADKTKDMLLSVESNLQNFFIEVDNIRIDITGKSVSGEAMDIPLWKRALAAGTGFVCGDISSAFTGSMVGFTKGLAKQIAIQFGLYFTLALFGLLNPVTIIAAIGIGFIIGFAGMKKQLTYKIKEKLKPELKKQVEQVGFDSIEKICTGIQVKIAEICKQITGSMENEISAIRTQVEDIINKIKAGQDEVNKCIKEFDTSEENIKKVNTELDDFIFNLIQKETVIERECVNV
jgi:hypothetical protein